MRPLFLPLLAAAVLLACSTPQSRIKHHRDVFDAAPADVQAKIKKGQIDIGFTPDEVYLALGRPQRTFVTKTAGAPEQEIWIYRTEAPRAGFGIGFGFRGPVGVGVAGGPGPGPGGMSTRVIFQNDAVVSIQQSR